MKSGLLLGCLFTALLTNYLTGIVLNENNVCNTFEAYEDIAKNNDCYFDSDTKLEPQEIIKKYTNTSEIVHEITGLDGYVITLFHLEKRHPKGVILMHPPTMFDSRMFLWQGNESFAMLLWHRGYDVWLANHRGSRYSSKHQKMNSSQYEYWDFAFHEIAMNDIGEELQLIRKVSGPSKIIFMGHSWGGDVGLVYASLKAQEAEKYLHSMILISPPTSGKNVTSPIKAIMEVETVLKRFTNFDVMENFVDFPWKLIFHYAQLRTAGDKFVQYDYGAEKNLEIYGSNKPPLYPLENINVPVLLVSGDKDTLITSQATEFLYRKIPNAFQVGHWVFKGLNHMDFFLGRQNKEKFDKGMFDYLDSIVVEKSL